MKSTIERYKEMVGAPVEELRQDSRTLIIDGLNTYIRAFTAVPALSDNGEHIGGLIGFMRSLVHVMNKFQPTQVIVVFDGKGGSARRKKIYKDYKEKRTPKITLNRYQDYGATGSTEEAFVQQLQRVALYLDTLPLKSIVMDYVEADDVIAYITKQILNQESQKVVIVSSDKDFLQLVSPSVSVYRPIKKALYDPDRLKLDYDLVGKNFLLRRCFEGDLSDNITGVKGVGHKTLLKLFEEYIEKEELEIDVLLKLCQEEVDKGTKKKAYKTIVESKDILLRNYQLMQLQEVDISAEIKSRIRSLVSSPVPLFDIAKFKQLFKEDKLYTIIPDINNWIVTPASRLNKYASRK